MRGEKRPSRRRFLRGGLATGLGSHSSHRVRVKFRLEEYVFPNFELVTLSDESADEPNGRTATTVTSGLYTLSESAVEITSRFTIDDDSSEISSVANIGSGIAISEYAGRAELRIALLSRNMEPQLMRTLPGKHTLFAHETHDTHLYAASDRWFYVFDPELAVVRETTLPSPLREKEMDEILVHDGIAYVVDDVVFPRYLLRVDLTDPEHLEYSEVIEIEGVDQTLNHQWIDPDTNEWMILQSASTRAGRS